MVIIQPFVYEKITAFKERVQIISKVNEIIDTINSGEIGISEDEVISLIENKLLNYYTKAEVDNAIASIDLSDFYTKSETNGMLNLKRDISDSYNKTEIDSKDSVLSNRITENESDIENLENTKQDNISVVSPIVKTDNELSIDSDKVIVNGIKNTEYNKAFIVRVDDNHYLDFASDNYESTYNSANFVRISNSGISLRNSNYGALNKAIWGLSGTLPTSSNKYGSLDIGVSFRPTTSPELMKVASFICASFNGGTNVYCILGKTVSTGYFSGLEFDYGSSGRILNLGSIKEDSTQPQRLMREYALQVDGIAKKTYIIKNNVKSEVVTQEDITNLNYKNPTPIVFSTNVMSNVQNNDLVFISLTDANNNSFSFSFLKAGTGNITVWASNQYSVIFNGTTNAINVIDNSTQSPIGISNISGYFIRP